MHHIEHKARIFATAAHHAAGNVRKYTGEPYIHHPAAVVALVESVPHTPAMLAAAWLHDTVEDTHVTLGLIEAEFGPDVAAMVEMLTDVSHANDGLRKHRKAKDREHTAKASPAAKTIKLADLIDNTRSIVERDPEFAKVYLEEKRLLLKVLTEGDQTLYEMARQLAYGEMVDGTTDCAGAQHANQHDAEALVGLRVREARGCGTMRSDDFILVAYDSDRVVEIREAVLQALGPVEGAEPLKAEPVPVEAIGRLLTEAMDKAVENGASSVSMPDDYVAVAAWLCRVEGADNG